MNKQRYDDIVAFLQSKREPDTCSSLSNFRRDAAKFSLQNGVLYRNGGIVVLEENREELWEAYHCGPHNTGHFGNFLFPSPKKEKKKTPKKKAKLDGRNFLG